MHSKGNYKQVEKTTLRIGEIITDETTDRRLISKIYKELIQLSARETNNPIKNWEKALDMSANIQVTNKHMKRCSTLFIIREVQIKTTVRYHQSEWPSAKSLQLINYGEGVEKRECSCTVGGNIN